MQIADDNILMIAESEGDTVNEMNKMFRSSVI